MTWVRVVVVAALIALVTGRVYGGSLRAAGVRRRDGVDQACATHAPEQVSGWRLDQDLSYLPPELVCTWTDPATAESVTVAPTGQSAVIYFGVAVLGVLALVVWVVVAGRRVNRRGTPRGGRPISRRRGWRGGRGRRA